MVSVGIRTALSPTLGDLAPYALNFIAITLAAVLAGWRSGLVTIIASQTLAWYAIVPNAAASPAAEAMKLPNFVIATLTQLIILTIIGLYQREVDKGAAEREQRLALLDQALREIDHRTGNNYQTVLALIDLQARRAESDDVRQALRQVSERIEAVANASQRLSLYTKELDAIRLDDHLCGLVQYIERGLSRDDIEVECDVDEVTASAEAATSISIIVNELVTNALKHAFNGERAGRVSVRGKSGGGFELIVADDGTGIAATRRDGHNGLGTKLVERFARQLNAHHEIVSSDSGTTHRLVIPHLS